MKCMFRTDPSAWHLIPLRLALGLVFMGHGAQKLFGWFGGPGLEKATQSFESMGITPAGLWTPLAAGGEFFGGALVLAGLLTRLSALNLAVIMAVAMAAVHWKNGFFLSQNGIEFNLALLAMSLSLVIAGGGAWSADLALSGQCCKKAPAPAAES